MPRSTCGLVEGSSNRRRQEEQVGYASRCVRLPLADRGDRSAVSEEAVVGVRTAETPSRAGLAALLVLVALLPLLALAWLAATGLGKSEPRKADLRLEP